MNASKTKNSRTTRTAEQTYHRRAGDIAALMDLIGQELKMHAEFAEEEGIHWAHAGDLGRLKEQLIEALAFVSQQDKAFVEATLEDLRQ